jgi:phosphoesterase RecJ-like protein
MIKIATLRYEKMNLEKFKKEIQNFAKALESAKNILITSPGAADGDSIGSQLAIRRMILYKHPQVQVSIINDEALPPRYHFMPDTEYVYTPETYAISKQSNQFDLAIIVDGGIDRAGRVREFFEKAKTQVFIDHHVISIEYPYTIRIVEPTACATAELVYYISQTPTFSTPIEKKFAEQIYLGIIFDTGFFRHSNTTPEVMELGAMLLRTGINFTRIGERGMLERTFSSLQLMSHTLSNAQVAASGKVIWSQLSQKTLHDFSAHEDDREGIIDHLFLTQGAEVAILFFELAKGGTKVSLRSQGSIDVAKFARSLTEHGGGHKKAAGANLEESVDKVIPKVLENLSKLFQNPDNAA